MNSEQLTWVKEHFDEISYGIPIDEIKRLKLRPFVRRIQRRVEGRQVSLYCLTDDYIKEIKMTLVKERNEEIEAIAPLPKIDEPESLTDDYLALWTSLVQLYAKMFPFSFKSFNDKLIKDKNNVKSNHQGCYLLQLNCDEGSNKYKIGKAKNLLERLKSTEYKNAFIYSTQFVQDEDACEREIIREFTSKFELVRHDTTGGFGSEMFAGDIKEMVRLFQEICNSYI